MLPRLCPVIGLFQRVLVFFDWLWLVIAALHMRELMSRQDLLLKASHR